MRHRRSLLRTAGLLLPFLSLFPLIGIHNDARAQTYPHRPVTVVIAYTPGSANDILVRLISPTMGQHLGQPVIVSNKPGAGGIIGMTAVATAKADGYTLGLGSTSTIAINKALYKSITYDPASFASIIKLASTPNVLVVPASSPIKTVKDLTQAMSTKVLNYSSPGNGTTQHLAGARFVQMVGKPAEHIVFKGPAEAVTALASGQIDYGFVSLPSALGQIRDNRLRALAVTPLEPNAQLPDVPSLSTQGMPGFEKTDVWFGLVAPEGTPKDVLQALNKAAGAALDNADLRARLTAAGFDPAKPASGEDFAQFVADQLGFWADLVKSSGASVD